MRRFGRSRQSRWRIRLPWPECGYSALRWESKVVRSCLNAVTAHLGTMIHFVAVGTTIADRPPQPETFTFLGREAKSPEG